MVDFHVRELKRLNILRLMEEKGIKKKKQLAEMYGCSQPFISGILKETGKKGAQSIGEDVIDKLRSLFDVDTDEFYRIDVLGAGTENKTFTEFTFIPKYKARLSGGGGSLESSDLIEANLAFRKDWLSHKGLSRNNLALFEVVGDSMAPCITHGAVVMVDLSQKSVEDIVDGKIYAFRQDDRVKVKRLWLEGKTVRYRSDNTLEGDEGAFDLEKDNGQIIGKVVWVGHEVR